MWPSGPRPRHSGIDFDMPNRPEPATTRHTGPFRSDPYPTIQAEPSHPMPTAQLLRYGLSS